MTLCKYYLKGYCHFGNSCRFVHANRDDHSYNDHTYGRSSGISVMKSSGPPPRNYQHHFSQHYETPQPTGMNQSKPTTGRSLLTSSFSSSNEQQYKFSQQGYQSPQQPVAVKYNLYDLMQLVYKDVVMAERGNQWPLSCYCAIKELNNLPELIDYSPEELRWEYYVAAQCDRLPVCHAIVQQLYANAAKVNDKLKKKDTAYKIIEKWVYDNESQLQTGNLSVSETLPDSVDSFSFTLPPEQPAILESASFQNQPYSPQPPSSANIFCGKNQTQVLSPVSDNSNYTPVEELSEHELEAFKGKFVFGHLPTKPPPSEMCQY